MAESNELEGKGTEDCKLQMKGGEEGDSGEEGEGKTISPEEEKKLALLREAGNHLRNAVDILSCEPGTSETGKLALKAKSELKRFQKSAGQTLVGLDVTP